MSSSLVVGSSSLVTLDLYVSLAVSARRGSLTPDAALPAGRAAADPLVLRRRRVQTLGVAARRATLPRASSRACEPRLTRFRRSAYGALAGTLLRGAL